MIDVIVIACNIDGLLAVADVFLIQISWGMVLLVQLRAMDRVSLNHYRIDVVDRGGCPNSVQRFVTVEPGGPAPTHNAS